MGWGSGAFGYVPHGAQASEAPDPGVDPNLTVKPFEFERRVRPYEMKRNTSPRKIPRRVRPFEFKRK